MSAGHPTPEMFQRVLARLETDAAVHYGCVSLRLVPAGLQERPASHVLRLGVYRNSDGHLISHLFVKLFKPKLIEGGPNAMHQRVARDHEVTRQAHAALSAYTDVGAVRPVACYPDLLAIVTEEVTGATLLDYLEAQVAWFPTRRQITEARETMSTVGRWIRVFQAANPTCNSLTIGDLRQYIDVRLQRLVHHAGRRFTPAHRDRVLRHIEQLGAAIPPEDLRQVTAHSDMSLGNVLVSGRRVVVIDFAMTRLDTRLLDITKVFLQVDLLRVKPQYRNPVIDQLQSALIEGFDPSLTTDRPLFNLVMLLHRVNHLTSLYGSPGVLFKAIYNRAVCRQHRLWIAGELERGAREDGR